MSELSHDQIRELLGAYALDAMDGDESVVVETHLDSCDECAEEVRGHHAVAAALANSGGNAPPHLWDTIESRLGSQSIDLGGSSSPRPNGHPLATPGQRARSSRTRTWIAVAASVVLFGLLAGEIVHLNSEVQRYQGQSASQQVLRAARTAMADPHATQVTLTSSSRRVAQIAVLPSGAAFLVNDALPGLSGARTYQLWGQKGRALVSLGLLGNNPSAIAFQIGPGDHFQAFAITDEHAGGVVRTRNEPVATGSIGPSQIRS